MRVTEPSGFAEVCWGSVILMIVKWVTKSERAGTCSAIAKGE